MNLLKIALALALAFAASVASPATAGDDALEAFPPAEAGMTRYLIELPHKERGEDDDFRVQLIVGKTILTDGVNRYMISGGTIEAKSLKGWGYTYYQAAAFGPVASTQMAAIGGGAPAKRFVQASSEILPYNSRLPLVIYVPDGGEVQYRIWKAAGAAEAADAK